MKSKKTQKALVSMHSQIHGSARIVRAPKTNLYIVTIMILNFWRLCYMQIKEVLPNTEKKLNGKSLRKGKESSIQGFNVT
jgi:hypothetical protein